MIADKSGLQRLGTLKQVRWARLVICMIATAR
jgi:hypothetical protein